MTRLLLFVLAYAVVIPNYLRAQPTQPELPQRLDTEWILRYEQSFGVNGLYVEEPPSDHPAAQVRLDLLILTRAARKFQQQYPGEVITPQRMLATGFISQPIEAPEGTTYTYSDQAHRFVSSQGGLHDLSSGALLQLQAAEEYRRRVTQPSLLVWQQWTKFENSPSAPELIKREIETRRFAIRHEDSGPIRAARQTQEQLQQLNDAIEMAIALGNFQQGQEITMQDVGRTGLIDLLPALPMNGKYKVTKAGEAPAAVFGETEVPFDVEYIDKRLKYQAAQLYRAQPDYPPAMAIAARYLDGAQALDLLSRAIEKWPDVPALRVQRLATNAQMFNVDALKPETPKEKLSGYLDAISSDMEYLMARFPAAPIIIEVDLAISQGALAQDMHFRGSIAETMANIRPEVLNAQLMGILYLMQAGETNRAQRLYDRLVEIYPGYAPLLPNPSQPDAAPRSEEPSQ